MKFSLCAMEAQLVSKLQTCAGNAAPSEPLLLQNKPCDFRESWLNAQMNGMELTSQEPSAGVGRTGTPTVQRRTLCLNQPSSLLTTQTGIECKQPGSDQRKLSRNFFISDGQQESSD